MATFTSQNGMQELRDRLDENNGVLSVTMRDLRNAYGKERLGSNVRKAITNILKSMGISCYPRELPADQDVCIRLYRRKSRVGCLIRAALRPGCLEDNELIEAATSDAEIKLEQIRELICD